MLLKRNVLRLIFTAWKIRKDAHLFVQEKQQERNCKKQKSFVAYDRKELPKMGKLHSLTKLELLSTDRFTSRKD